MLLQFRKSFIAFESVSSFISNETLYQKWPTYTFLCSFFEYIQYIKSFFLHYNSSIYLIKNEKWYHYIFEISSYCKNHVHVPNSFLTLLKLGAPSVCGASFTSLSMPSKWSVIALHVEMSAMMMFYFLFKHNI